MEYIPKSELIEYLEGLRKNMTLEGKTGHTVSDIINQINGMYTYSPSLQSTWIRKRNVITCSKCDFKTLYYKNSPFCPNCGRSMANGKVPE